jgi:hypothetical protein
MFNGDILGNNRPALEGVRVAPGAGAASDGAFTVDSAVDTVDDATSTAAVGAAQGAGAASDGAFTVDSAVDTVDDAISAEGVGAVPGTGATSDRESTVDFGTVTAVGTFFLPANIFQWSFSCRESWRHLLSM